MPFVFPTLSKIKSHPITENLIRWFSETRRDLPWRRTKNPYLVWVSEVILQQTRIDQGRPYYERFVASFPSIYDLAKAEEDAVLGCWQGLGYYSRARNMHSTAKHIVYELKGKFPNNFSDLLKLKGVGPYTAAAIASICFKQCVPTIDGNVFRVSSRLFGIKADISLASSRKIFWNILGEIILKENPGDFNQALMEYGATICTPSPKCEICVLIDFCFAHKNKRTREFPVKSSKITVKNREINYVVFYNEVNFLLNKRSGNDIWKGLYDFPELKANFPNLSKFRKDGPFIHLLSHQKLHVCFFFLPLVNRFIKNEIK